MENTTIVAGKSGVIEATAKLVIKDFVEVMGGFKPGVCIESDSFMLGDTPLAILVYPNGDEQDCKGHVGLFLRNHGNDEFGVKGQLITDLDFIDFDYSRPVGAGSRSGIDKFLTHTQCADAYKDSDFVVKAKLEIPGEVTKLVGRESAAATKKQKFNVLENLYSKMAGTDFTLVFEGEEVPCHKIILAAASPVLEAMVENKDTETIESRANIKLSAEVGRAFIRFIYSGELQEDLLKEHALAFLAMGELYDLEQLKDLAEKELLAQLKKQNMVEMIYIGELFEAEDIFEAALKMTKINMTWVQNQVWSMSIAHDIVKNFTPV